MRPIYKIAAKDASESARSCARVSFLTLAAAVVLFLSDFAVWVGWIFLVISIAFVIEYFQYRNISKLYRKADIELTSGSEHVEDDEVRDLKFTEIDIGMHLGVIPVYDLTTTKRGHECFDSIVSLIDTNKGMFVDEFRIFIERSVGEHPEWLEAISVLEIERLDVYDVRKMCFAVVVFRSIEGEFWRAEYINGHFSKIIWN